MAALDTDNARLVEPAQPPVAPGELSRARLVELVDRVEGGTWDLGLRRWFWGEGVCLLGLVQAGRAAHGALPERVEQWYDERLLGPSGSDLMAGIDHVNEVACGAAAVEVLLADQGERTAYRPTLESLAAWATGPAIGRDATGAMEHWPGGVWADTMFMVGTFLARMAALTGEARFAREALRQLTSHAEVLQADNGLWVHGSHAGEAIPCHWGRANAWAALSMVDVLTVLGPLGLDVDDAPVRASLTRLLDALVPLQPEHGVWDVLVDGQPECRGIPELSATAGLAAALLRADTLLGTGRYAAAGDLALRAAAANVDDAGMLRRVSAGTVLQLIPFGYSVIRDDRPQPWGQGLMLTALAAGLSTGPGAT